MFETVLGLDPVGAGVVDALEGLAHPVGARGLEPLPLQAALGLKLEFGQVRLVFEPQVLRPFQQAVLPAPAFPALSTASLACSITWNLSMTLAASGSHWRMPWRIPGSCRTSPGARGWGRRCGP